ncbi:MAG TPA: AMP-binding protein [Acidimicrobiales bacterium]|jgi:long-chain acyl-CoA synthetase|nr:AMP-binding protein [Acidimicrobiales bacterium]
MRNPWDQRLGIWYIAQDRPEQPAIVESPTGEVLTFGELAGRAHQLVHALRARGVGDGDVVAYALPNGVDIIVWQLATSEAGMRSLALNPALTSEEMWEIAQHAAAKAVVIHADYQDRAAMLGEQPNLVVRVMVDGSAPGFVDQDDLIADHPTTPPEGRAAGSLITYSSGTTGKPKGVWREQIPADPWALADLMKSFGHAFRFLPFEGTHLVTAGLSHGGCFGFAQGALNVGQSLAIHKRFDAEEALRAIERHRVTTAYMVPTQFVRLLHLPDEVRARHDTSSLQVVVHSAAPCPLETKRQMMEWWGPVIWETYGGMEGAATIAKPERWLEKPGTVGRAVRGVSVLILDDGGEPLPAGEIGQVYIRSDGPDWVYKDDPNLTDSVRRGDAFTIGDVGYLDDDGFLFICDRAKDMIIRGGVNIYPAEVEGTLSSHPAVRDVAVIGVPDAEWGEQVKAIVEVEPTVEASDALADELMAHCRAHLASFKCPRSVDFRAELPRTEAGKLYKRLLRDEYWEAAGRRV